MHSYYYCTACDGDIPEYPRHESEMLNYNEVEREPGKADAIDFPHKVCPSCGSFDYVFQVWQCQECEKWLEDEHFPWQSEVCVDCLEAGEYE